MVAIVTGLLLCSLLTFVAPLSAQQEASEQAGGNEKVPPTWFLRVEGGAAKIHDRDPSSAWLGARFGRKILRNGILRWDMNLAGSGADEGFFTFTGGIELQPVPSFIVSPIIRAEIGLLAEP
jgi:hypothetical protein